VDGVPLHWTVATMPCKQGHACFDLIPLPKAAAWLNLIEGFWKIHDQRALAGRERISKEEVDQALHAGIADWSRPTLFVWEQPLKCQRELERT
jgi:hypothetical protein